MATMHQASIKRQVGFAQVATKTDQEILRMRLKRNLARESITSAQAEIDQIDAQMAASREALEYTQRVQADLERKAEEARQFAQRAVGTLAEKEAHTKLRDAEKQLTHRAEITQGLVDTDKEETPQLLARKFDLQLASSDARKAIEQAEKQLTTAEAVKAQAFAQLGEAEKSEHIETLTGYDERLRDLRMQIVKEEAGRLRYLEEQALPLLRDWPEHVRELGKLRKRDDAFTAGLEGLCRTLEAMVEYPVMFPPNLSMQNYPTARWSGGELSQLTCIPIEELRIAARGDRTLLKQRLVRCQALLAEARGVER